MEIIHSQTEVTVGALKRSLVLFLMSFFIHIIFYSFFIIVELSLDKTNIIATIIIYNFKELTKYEKIGLFPSKVKEYFFKEKHSFNSGVEYCLCITLSHARGNQFKYSRVF